MNYVNQINQLKKEIANLRKAEAQETQKEADIQAKINRANEAATRTKSTSTLQNELKKVERASKDLATVQKKRAEISGKIADKSKSLHSYEERQAREDERERKKISDEQKRLIREREEHERKITSEIRRRTNLSSIPTPTAHAQKDNYDFFISHASEDKDGFVLGMAEVLEARGAKVWYDEFTLKMGDSLRREIDRGLANSRFGVVVLSKYFFDKEWPQKELDGLVSLEVEGATRILPVWHEISKDEIVRHSPMLADKVALNTSLKSTDEIADELYRLIE
ncbi:MAG: TIR domain-containing protein [Gemmatimonadetes bacterium]|nr:TIR domain-containing protein [Gemmatimonadota bacterium]MYB71795.1 TIR domain-containing protein [Gemmatimonadota bacterium]